MDAIGKAAFWAGMICELIVSVSGYAFGGYKEPWIIMLGMFFFACSVCTHLELRKNWLLYCICAVVGLGYYYLQSSALILRIILILLAGRRQKPEDVVKFFFWGTLGVMLYTAALAALGLHNTVSLTQNFRHEEETRYCFGFFHPNGFAFFLFRTMTMGLYGYGERLKGWMYVLTGAAGIGLFWLAGSKMGLVAAICVLAAFWIIRHLKTEKLQKGLYYTGIALMELEILFVLVCMAWFNPYDDAQGEGIWQVFNEIMTGRAYAIHDTFTTHLIPLWGYQNFMSATEVGFVNALYNQGIVFLAVYIGVLFYLFYKMYQKKDLPALVLILGFTFYAMSEAFLPYFNKNGVWMLLIGLNMLKQEKRSDEKNKD